MFSNRNYRHLIKVAVAVIALAGSTPVFAAQYIWTADSSKHASTRPEAVRSKVSGIKFMDKCVYADYRFEPGDLLVLGDINLACVSTYRGAMWLQTAPVNAKVSMFRN